MITVSDYISYLVGEVARAKVGSDLNSLKIAKAYASDEFLSRFPIPRLAFGSVEMQIPMLVEKAALDKSADYSRLQTGEFEVFAAALIQENFKKHFDAGWEKPEILALQQKIQADLKVWLDALEESGPDDKAINALSAGLYNAALQQKDLVAQYQKTKGIPLREFADQLKKYLSDRIVYDKEKLSRLTINPETFHIKAGGTPGSVIQLKISLVEESLEWDSVEDADGQERKILTIY